MIKTVLTLLGINILLEHPYIILGIIIAVCYFIYNNHQEEQNKDENSYMPKSIPSEVLELIHNKRRFGDFSVAQRKKIVSFCDDVDLELAINGDKLTSVASEMIDAKIQARIKIEEFQTTTPLINMSPEERESVFYEIKRLNEKQNDISKTDRIRLTLLLSQRLQYKMRTLSPEDKETYNKLFGKKIRNESFTEGETMKYNELHQIVMNTPPIIND